MLLKLVSDLRINSDANKASILVPLDLSAAFDTIDHHILLQRLEALGISGPVLNWFKVYIKQIEAFRLLIIPCQDLLRNPSGQYS